MQALVNECTQDVETYLMTKPRGFTQYVSSAQRTAKIGGYCDYIEPKTRLAPKF